MNSRNNGDIGAVVGEGEGRMQMAEGRKQKAEASLIFHAGPMNCVLLFRAAKTIHDSVPEPSSPKEKETGQCFSPPVALEPACLEQVSLRNPLF